MKKFILLTILFFALIVSCKDDTDFSTQESDCQIIEITNNGKTLTLEKDTAWFVCKDNQKLFYCDKFKTYAFFNVLRDLQLQGLSGYSKDVFEYVIDIKNSDGKTIKSLKFNSVPNSAQLIGKIDDGKCYIVGVPGLNDNPAVNFSSDAGYWKNLSLLDINLDILSSIKIQNFVDENQSFEIKLSGNNLDLFSKTGKIESDTQEILKDYLGSIAGTYRAKEYLQPFQLSENQLIYILSLTNNIGIETEIKFYKKIDNGNPDFNLMYFKHDDEFGTAKYYDFEKILIDLDKLKGIY